MYHHGGEIYHQKIKYDFSVNTNPLGMPQKVKDFLSTEKAIYFSTVYPENQSGILMERIAKKEGVLPNQVVCGNGASELIHSVFSALPRGKVLLVIPGFSEYERAALIYGWDVIYYEMKEEMDFVIGEDILESIENNQPDLVVIVNPSNPVGNLISNTLLKKIVDMSGEFGGQVLIDECFLPFIEESERLSAKKYMNQVQSKRAGNCIILRAFTKIYAMAGIRLGYLILADAELADDIRNRLPDWNVSSIAQQTGMLALEEENYLTETRVYLQRERKWLADSFKKLGFQVYPGEANFILIKGKKGLKEKLIEREILIRDCSNYKGLESVDGETCFYRIAVRKHEENEVLIRECKNEQRNS